MVFFIIMTIFFLVNLFILERKLALLEEKYKRSIKRYSQMRENFLDAVDLLKKE